MIHFLAARIARRSVVLPSIVAGLTAIVRRLNLITQCNASNAVAAEHTRDGVKKLQMASKLFAIVHDRTIQRDKASPHSIRLIALRLILQLERVPCVPQ
jgi:hypothetical protein